MLGSCLKLTALRESSNEPSQSTKSSILTEIVSQLVNTIILSPFKDIQGVAYLVAHASMSQFQLATKRVSVKVLNSAKALEEFARRNKSTIIKTALTGAGILSSAAIGHYVTPIISEWVSPELVEEKVGQVFKEATKTSATAMPFVDEITPVDEITLINAFVTFIGASFSFISAAVLLVRAKEMLKDPIPEGQDNEASSEEINAEMLSFSEMERFRKLYNKKGGLELTGDQLSPGEAAEFAQLFKRCDQPGRVEKKDLLEIKEDLARYEELNEAVSIIREDLAIYKKLSEAVLSIIEIIEKIKEK